MKKIYISLDVTGTESDLVRAEGIRQAVLREGHLPIIPLLMFKEVLGVAGDAHGGAVEFCAELIKSCDELRIYDSPQKSVVCNRDNEFALNLGIPVVDMCTRQGYSTDLAEIMQHYQHRIGGFPVRQSVYDIEEYLKAGFSPEVIKYAIDIGVRGGKPWVYINAIVQNLRQKGLFTMELVNAAVEKKQETTQQPQRKNVFLDLAEDEL